jgi:hypothetical protein
MALAAAEGRSGQYNGIVLVCVGQRAAQSALKVEKHPGTGLWELSSDQSESSSKHS